MECVTNDITRKFCSGNRSFMRNMGDIRCICTSETLENVIQRIMDYCCNSVQHSRCNSILVCAEKVILFFFKSFHHLFIETLINSCCIQNFHAKKTCTHNARTDGA